MYQVGAPSPKVRTVARMKAMGGGTELSRLKQKDLTERQSESVPLDPDCQDRVGTYYLFHV